MVRLPHKFCHKFNDIRRGADTEKSLAVVRNAAFANGNAEIERPDDAPFRSVMVDG